MHIKNMVPNQKKFIRNYENIPSDGFPELVVLIPNRIVQIYCKLRKIDKIGKIDSLIMIMFVAFALFAFLYFQPR
jgi:hypothetical protein